jgi:probable HAF family extracellular repeat protein
MRARLLFPGLLLTALASATAASPHYIVTDLGAFGGPDKEATAINSLGQVVGFSNSPSDSALRAFLYSGGAFTDLGTLGGNTSLALGMNNRGQVVGASVPAFDDGMSHAFLFDHGTLTDLGMLPGTFSAVATGINDSGQIVGSCGFDHIGTRVGNHTSTQTSFSDHAFIYQNGVMTDLGSLNGMSGSIATAINDRGEIVGTAVTARNIQHAFLYRNGVMKDLGPFEPGRPESGANAINNKGVVVGFADTENDTEAFVYRDKKMIPLGKQTLSANGINSRDTIVGDAVAAKAYAFIVYDGGKATDLNDYIPASSGWQLETEAGINDAGQIVGYGRKSAQDYRRAYLLTPISVVTIAGAKNVRTRAASLRIHGRVSGTVGRVFFRNGATGPFGRAVGTARWHARVHLHPGKNVVTVYASAHVGDSFPEQVTIHRR